MIVNFFGQDIARRRRVGGVRFLTAELSLPKLQHYRSRFHNKFGSGIEGNHELVHQDIDTRAGKIAKKRIVSYAGKDLLYRA